MYIAYADMMAKVLPIPLGARCLPCQPLAANPSSYVLFQSCAEGEEEVEEEGKEKTFEVKLRSFNPAAALVKL